MGYNADARHRGQMAMARRLGEADRLDAARKPAPPLVTSRQKFKQWLLENFLAPTTWGCGKTARHTRLTAEAREAYGDEVLSWRFTSDDWRVDD